MTTDLDTRLRRYRDDLDGAIERRLSDASAYVPLRPDSDPELDRAAGRRRWAVGAALTTAVACVLTMVLFVAPDGDSGTRTITPAATPPEGRVILDAPGWHMSRIDEANGRGEMTFTDGTREVDLRWVRGDAGDLQREIDGRFGKLEARKVGEVASTSATVFKYGAANDYVAMWAATPAYYEVRGPADSGDAFVELAGHVRTVDLATWEAALPDTAVTSERRGDVVDRMLAGVPLPAGFDPASLRTSQETKDRYQLGAQVMGAVACRWIEDWAAARAAGDSERAAAASAALQTAHDWTELRAMDADGDFPEVVWQYADAVAAGAPVLGGKPLSVEESYRDALGCP